MPGITERLFARSGTLWRRLADPAVAAISVDVYDTLLLRGTRPELLRFGDIAMCHHGSLVAAGYPSPGEAALWKARLVVHKRAYDEVGRSGGEVRLTDILSALVRHAGLPEDALPQLAAAEVAYEHHAIRPNRALARMITAVAGFKPVALVSDMYLPGNAVARIVAHHLPGLAALPLLVSSDAQASKRRGDLFARLPPLLGVEKQHILHLGDDPAADVAQARNAGCQALHLPRPELWRWLHEYRRRHIRQKLDRLGWLEKTPAPYSSR